jgi:hypothetical protein
LGYIVSHEGVKVDRNKIKAMMEWPIPKTLKNLRGFLGLTSYYCKFVNNYGQIIAPLTTLLKNEAFSWTQEATRDFENLRRLCVLLLSLPCLTSRKPLLCSVIPQDMALVWF